MEEDADDLLSYDLSWGPPTVYASRTNILWWFLVSGPIERKSLNVKGRSMDDRLRKPFIDPCVEKDIILTGWEKYIHFSRDNHARDGPPGDIDLWINSVSFPPLEALGYYMLHHFLSVPRYLCSLCATCV